MFNDCNSARSEAICGKFFYAGSSTSYEALLIRCGNECIISTRCCTRLARHPIDQTEISEPIGKLPYRFSFSDGAVFETQQHHCVEQQYCTGSQGCSWIHRLEQNWRWALLCLALIPVLAYSFLNYAVPVIAKPLAAKVPKLLKSKLDQQVLESIDGGWLGESKASDDNNRRLKAAWAKVPNRDNYTLLQRDGKLMGANAFALPGGTIVVTDQLLETLPSINEITAVLAHEAGHVANNHGVRNIIQATGVAVTLSAIIGDVSWLAESILITAPTVLQQTAYSRDLEREADLFAYQQLQAIDIEPSCLGAGLSHLVQAHDKQLAEEITETTTTTGTTEAAAEPSSETPATTAGTDNGSSDLKGGTDVEKDPRSRREKINDALKQQKWFDYLSTHPAIQERIEQSGGTHCL